MAELDYAELVGYLVTVLTGDPRLDGVNITQDFEEPTAELCPAVLVMLRSAQRQPWELVSGVIAGAPDRVITLIDLECWEFSGQGTGAAARQRDTLVKNVIDVVRDNVQLGGRVDWVLATRIAFDLRQSAGSIFAVGTVTLEAQGRY